MTKFAILGAGGIARFHAKAVKALADAELIAVADCAADRAAAFAAELGLPATAAFASADEMLVTANPDVLLVATPSGLHHEGIEAAIRRRTDVLCEKPLEISTERIDALGAAAKAADVRLGCIFQTRWTDEFLEAKAKLASGELGRITYASAQVPWWRSDEYYAQGGWRGTYKVDGGGALMNQAIHMVDWLVALMGAPTDVKGLTATLAHPIETEDTAAAVLRFADGALGHVYATTASCPGAGKRLELHGTKGTFVVGDDVHGVSNPNQLDYEPHRRCFEAFAAARQGGAPYPIDGANARKAVDLIARIYAQG